MKSGTRTNNYDEIVLLDTHIWIWLLNGSEKSINPKCLTFINKAVIHSNIKVSAISVWEVGMLEAKGKIKFPIDCLDWVEQALGAPGISLAPITPEIAIKSSRLPGNFHGDPADRIIVSTARKLNATLITHDKNILRYSNLTS